jgi:hypothetical protein
MTPDLFEGLLERLADADVLRADVIPWSSPVPAFGNPNTSCVGTVGLNPSNREFVDQFGQELTGTQRRFETLASLGIRRWSNAKRRHIQRIAAACECYFSNNPYDGWFRRLDLLISDTQASFYLGTATHLDLIPFATSSKWGQLSASQRDVLLRAAGDSLAATIRNSGIRVLVLNGASVVSQFCSLFSIRLDSHRVPGWTLQAETKSPVSGVAFTGEAQSLGGMALDKAVKILGFNHNIQSSYGVTKEVIAAIKKWIGRESEDALAPA